MALLEPFVVPGLDRAVLELLIISAIVLGLGLIVTISSIIGVIRAVRRRQRGGHSVAAVVLAVIATAIAASWLLYWVGHDITSARIRLTVSWRSTSRFVYCLCHGSWLRSGQTLRGANGRNSRNRSQGKS